MHDAHIGRTQDLPPILSPNIGCEDPLPLHEHRLHNVNMHDTQGGRPTSRSAPIAGSGPEDTTGGAGSPRDDSSLIDKFSLLLPFHNRSLLLLRMLPPILLCMPPPTLELSPALPLLSCSLRLV